MTIYDSQETILIAGGLIKYVPDDDEIEDLTLNTMIVKNCASLSEIKNEPVGLNFRIEVTLMNAESILNEQALKLKIKDQDNATRYCTGFHRTDFLPAIKKNNINMVEREIQSQLGKRVNLVLTKSQKKNETYYNIIAFYIN